MLPTTQSPRYGPVDKLEEEDFDLEDDSDTTLASTGFLQQQQHQHLHHQEKNARNQSENPNGKRTTTRRKKKEVERTQRILVWGRWATIILLQTLIVVLLLGGRGSLMGGWNGNDGTKGWVEDETETGGDVNGLYVPTSHRYEHLTLEESKFFPNMSSDADRMEIRHNWDMLMPLGSGSVLIPDYEKYPKLGLPIDDDPIRTGPIFEASWTHALHCLYYQLDTYHQLTLSSGKRFGFGGERNDMHAAHCFEYIRTQLLCMADMTLEGAPSVLGSEGEGQAHMCRDRREAIAWIEERRIDDIQSIVGP